MLVIGLGLAVTLVLVGGSLAGAPAPAPVIAQPGTVDAPRTVNVIMRDYQFNPNALHLVAGETVRFNIINGGLVAHDFVLGDSAVQRAWADAEALATPPAPRSPARHRRASRPGRVGCASCSNRASRSP